jgi:three-Cys-motif partner protein
MTVSRSTPPHSDPRDDFFEEPQGAAFLKHEIIRRHYGSFAAITGGTGKRVYILDAYAGPGQYEDGTPGSPAYAAQTAAFFQGKHEVFCLYVEKNPDRFRRLETLLATVPHEHKCFPAPIESCLDDILELTAGCPLLGFFDPFGLGLPFDLLTNKVLGRAKMGYKGLTPPTDIILNFSITALNRPAGYLEDHGRHDSTYSRKRQSTLETLNRALGGEWWQAIWTNAPRETRVQTVLDAYLARIKEKAGRGWAYGSVPVSDRWLGSPSYHLILFTANNKGLWVFNRALSMGQEKYQERARGGQLHLEDVQSAMWVASIAENILRILEGSSSFIVLNKMTDVLGDTIGWARDKHVREAIQTLAKKGQLFFSKPQPSSQVDTWRIQRA